MGPQQDVRSCPTPTRNDVSVLNISRHIPAKTNSTVMSETLFEQLGGERELKTIISNFIDKVFEDRMIGFFFRNSDRQRIKDMEYQLAANFLGARVKYQGRPLDQVHAKHPIMGGHFARRRQILSETLDFYRVPETIRAAWLAHTDKLRPLITSQQGSDCDPSALRQKARTG
jgi:hemoglobin